jgi:serine/threonine protein kinase
VSLPPGTRLGSYEITAHLGSGGMGEVYRAHDPRLGREVAIKVLPSQGDRTPRSRERSIREARAASARDVAKTQLDASPFLNGPNKNQTCVQAYDGVIESNGRYTFAPPLTAPDMKGSKARQFELTFVAVAPSGAQWQDDPEFETGN